MRAVLGRPLGATAMRGHACMLNWIGELPDADAVLRVAGGHWHDYGKSPRQGRKVGHATVRCDTATDLMQVLRRIGQSLGRQDQVAPVGAALAGAPARPIRSPARGDNVMPDGTHDRDESKTSTHNRKASVRG